MICARMCAGALRAVGARACPRSMCAVLIHRLHVSHVLACHSSEPQPPQANRTYQITEWHINAMHVYACMLAAGESRHAWLRHIPIVRRLLAVCHGSATCPHVPGTRLELD